MKSRVVQGSASSVPLLEGPIGKELLRVFLGVPKKSVAMVDGFTNEKLLYSELLRRSVNLAETLRFHEYSRANLAICSENCLEYFIPVVATLFNGCFIAPLNHLYTPYELEHVLNVSVPRVVFCSWNTLNKFLQVREKLDFLEKIVVLVKSAPPSAALPKGVETMEEFVREMNVDPETFRPAEGDEKTLGAVILCSSGTTGLPKGVALSHQTLNVALTDTRNPDYFRPDLKTMLMLLPFFHLFGFAMTLGTLAKAGTVVCLRKFDENVFLKAIQEHQVQVLPLAPPLAVFLVKSDKVDGYDLSSVKMVFCGAAPLSRNTEEELSSKLPSASIRQAYGLTESGYAVTFLRQTDVRHGSCGRALPFVSGLVRDCETGSPLGPGEVGELCWKGPSIMMGYYRNPEATRDAFTEDGWLKTGDLGYYDEEGYFYIIGRLKELIKYKGFQVAPAELEAVLLKHPGVADAGVVGLPDEDVGEKPVAFVVKKQNADISEEDIKNFVAGLVSPQKRLTGGVVFVDSIPKNPTGKVLRKELSALLLKVKS